MSAKPQRVAITEAMTGAPSRQVNFGKILLSSPNAVAPMANTFTTAPYGVVIASEL
jgi:hypothetical protein